MIKQSFLVTIYSLLLIWLPFLGPFIGGYYGAKQVRSFPEAVFISVCPMVALGIGTIVLFQKITFVHLSSIEIVVYLTMQQVGVLSGVVLRKLRKK